LDVHKFEKRARLKMLGQVVMSYSSKDSVVKPLVHGITVYGSITGTFTSILSLREERLFTAKAKGLKKDFPGWCMFDACKT